MSSLKVASQYFKGSINTQKRVVSSFTVLSCFIPWPRPLQEAAVIDGSGRRCWGRPHRWSQAMQNPSTAEQILWVRVNCASRSGSITSRLKTPAAPLNTPRWRRRWDGRWKEKFTPGQRVWTHVGIFFLLAWIGACRRDVMARYFRRHTLNHQVKLKPDESVFRVSFGQFQFSASLTFTNSSFSSFTAKIFTLCELEFLVFYRSILR